MKSFRSFLLERDAMDVIIKLLALADRPGTPEEGETALTQAKQLAQKYGIDLERAREQMMRNQNLRGGGSKPTSPPDVHPADLVIRNINIWGQQWHWGWHHLGRSRSPIAKEAEIWTYTKEGVTIQIHVPMNGATESNVFWYMFIKSNYYTLDLYEKGQLFAQLVKAFKNFPWKETKEKIDKEKKEKESKDYENAQQLTPEQQEVVDVALKYGYTLVNGKIAYSERIMLNDPYRLSIGRDGRWEHMTKTPAGTYKRDVSAKNMKGGAALEKWIKTKRQTEKKFSPHDEVNKIVKILFQFGFKAKEKIGNQNQWTNPVAGLMVTFGPNKISGALKKDDEIFWMISSEYVRKPGVGGGYTRIHDVKAKLGDKDHGHTAEELEASLSRLITKAEIGFEKVVMVLNIFGFIPDRTVVQHPESHMEYFNSKGKKYFVVVNPKTGAWELWMHLSFADNPTKDKEGHTADELNHILRHLKSLPHDPLDTP